MMSTVETEVRDLVDVVESAPEVPERQRCAVRDLAGDVLRQATRTDGLDLTLFAAAGLSLNRSCARPETPARTCTADPSAWFDDVGIRDREHRDEELETRHFERVGELSSSIDSCVAAIDNVVTTANTAINCLLEPAKRFLEVVLRLGIRFLIEPAVDLALDALRGAQKATVDRNCVIEDCLTEIAKSVDEAAQDCPAPAVEYGGSAKQAASSAAVEKVAATTSTSADCGCSRFEAREISTQAASAGTTGLQVSFNFDIDAKLCVDVQGLDLPAPQPPAHERASGMLGAFGAIGAAAALGALECFTGALECPPEPTPTPEPAPAPAPKPTPTSEGVIPPPPELAQVEEPAPPPKKLPLTEPAAAEAPAAQPAPESQAHDPWAMKKTGEW